MLGLDMLDVAIGLAFLYLLMSLVCSAAAELFEALMRFRARDLEHGIRVLLNDPSLVKAIYDHPLVNSLFAGNYGNAAPGAMTMTEKLSMRKRALPSYIPARNFALALLDKLLGANALNGTVPPAPVVPPAANQLAGNPVIALPAGPLHATATDAFAAVSKLVVAAGNDAAKARENVEEWFNSSMDRVSGWYKRRTQYILLIAGLAAAAIFNVDTIGVARVLAGNKTLRENVVKSAIAYAKEHANDKQAATSTAPPLAPATTTQSSEAVIAQVTATKKDLDAQIDALNKSGIPVGWKNPYLPMPDDPAGWALRLFGIFITACAISLGAPFWFDTLNKIIVVRSTVKPKEKSGIEGSKA